MSRSVYYRIKNDKGQWTWRKIKGVTFSTGTKKNRFFPAFPSTLTINNYNIFPKWKRDMEIESIKSLDWFVYTRLEEDD